MYLVQGFEHSGGFPRCRKSESGRGTGEGYLVFSVGKNCTLYQHIEAWPWGRIVTTSFCIRWETWSAFVDVGIKEVGSSGVALGEFFCLLNSVVVLAHGIICRSHSLFSSCALPCMNHLALVGQSQKCKVPSGVVVKWALYDTAMVGCVEWFFGYWEAACQNGDILALCREHFSVHGYDFSCRGFNRRNLVAFTR